MRADLRSGHSGPRRQIFLAAAIIAVTLIAYLPALRGGFCWDDRNFVTQNKWIRSSDGLRRFWFSTEPPDYFPLTSSVLWFEWRLWGTDAAGYHIVTLLFHAAGAVLLWRVLLRLRIPGAWLAGLIFAVHPVAAASAAWITELKNTLPMVFYLASLLIYLRFEDDACADKPLAAIGNWKLAVGNSQLRIGNYAFSLALFLLALLAKSSVVMLPAILLLCAWWRRGKVSRKDLLRSIPFFALSLILGLVTVWFQHHAIAAGAALAPEGFASRLAAAGWSLWFYLFKLLLPAGLCAVYPRWSAGGAGLIAFLPLALFIAGMACLWTRRRTWGRAPLFALAYFTLSLLPVLGFVDMSFLQYSLVADHFQYLAMIGIIAFGAAVLARSAGAGRVRALKYLGLAACVLLLGGLTWTRGALYGDDALLWQDNVLKNPAAWVAWNNLGLARNSQGRPKQAVGCFDEALKVRPEYAEAYNNRALVRVRLGEYELALRDYGRALEINPDDAATYVNRSAAYAALGHYDQALADCERAMQLKPGDAAAYVARGILRARRGESDTALDDYDQALALGSDDAQTWYNRGLAHAVQQRLDLALGDYSRALQRSPDFLEAHYERGRAELEMKRFADAIRDYSAAIALKPDYVEAYNNRAIARAQSGRREEAARDWTKAIALKPDYAEAYYNRARLEFDIKNYAQALSDVRMFQKLGGRPDPGFVRRVTEAAGGGQ